MRISKIATLLLILVLALGLLAACGGGDETPTEVPPTATTEPTVAPTATTAPTAEPTATSAPAATETPTEAAPTPETAASNDAAATTELTDTVAVEGYPAPSAAPLAETIQASAYPEPAAVVMSVEGYPITPTARVELQMGPKFTITLPLKAGASKVTGSGTPDLPILLVDVSDMGALLGETTIDATGNFTFELKTPLVGSHQVGLKLGDLEGTEFNAEDFSASPTYYDRPFVGTLLDLAPVNP